MNDRICRAYTTLTLKAVDDEQRVIEGIASTPATDRAGDIVEPAGAMFTLPLPLLWQHDARAPVGHVEAAYVASGGITIRARIAKLSDPGLLKDRLDEAWQSIKLGLVRGLSIGFKPVESEPIPNSFSEHFLKWDWLELSCVTIAANAEANITTIKSADRAARRLAGVVYLEPGERRIPGCVYL